MKALYFKAHGNLDVLRYGEVPEVTPGPGEVLLRVRACALNQLDVWVRRGWPGLKLEMPHWGGADVAGEIVALGPGVKGWEPGRRVAVDPGINTREDEFTRRGEHTLSPGYHILGEQRRGGAAEYACVPAVNLVALPGALSFEEAAAPLLVAMTAWRMLIGRGKLKAGESVLIVGAGGGVNSMALQIAKLAGAYVYVVTGDEKKAQKALALGADRVINRSSTDWSRDLASQTEGRGVDVVVDNVGQATLDRSMKAVARGGRILIVGNTSGPLAKIDIRYIFSRQISLIGSTMGTREDFLKVFDLLQSGRLHPVIDRVLPLSEGRDGYALLESGEHFGKIVLKNDL